MGSRRRAQSPSSVNKTSQWQLACVFHHAHSAPRCGYKRRARANAHQLFASEPSLANLWVSAKQDYSVGVTARQRRLLSSAAFWEKQRSRCYLPSALQRCWKRVFSKKQKNNLKEQIEKSSTSDGRLFKDGFPLVRFWMWSVPDFIWWSRSLPLVLGL